MADALGVLATGVSQILGRTTLMQFPPYTPSGIPIPLAVLDVVKDEMVEYEMEISDHPVEQGLEVSDHAQPKNLVVRLKGTISNTPLDLSVAIANIAAGGLSAFTSSQARSNLLNTGLSAGAGIVGSALQGNSSNVGASAFAGSVDAISRTILLYVFQNRTPFSIVTRRQRFDNMLIRRLSFPRNEETGFAVDFEMDIRQIRIVSPSEVSKTQVSEDVISTAASLTNLGNQSTQLASAQMQSAVKTSTLGAVPGVAAKSPGAFA